MLIPNLRVASNWFVKGGNGTPKLVLDFLPLAAKILESHMQPWTICYSLRFILLFTNMNVPRYILVVDTFVLAKSNMGQRE
jgi:hypothetical protein